MIIKNDKGERQYHPESIKEETALYYENLYKRKIYDPQPYHHKTKHLDIIQKENMKTNPVIEPPL